MSLINLSFCLIASFAKTASQGYNGTYDTNHILMMLRATINHLLR